MNLLTLEEIAMLENNDLTIQYDCSPVTKCAGFTFLHKLVLLTKKYPELNNVIRSVNPEEINKVNENGWSALFLEILNNTALSSMKTIKLLLELGADVNCRLKNGSPLFSEAMYCYNSTKIVKLLLKYGADINVRNNRGFTPLMRCVEYFNAFTIETIKLLLQLGVNINDKSNEGFTALMIASENSNSSSNIEVVRFLLDNGADIDMQDNSKRTALEIAAKYSNNTSSIETVQLLLHYKADINTTNYLGWTPLMVATNAANSTSNIETMRLLLKSSANVNIQNYNEDTALHIAVKNDNVDAIKLLLEFSASTSLQQHAGYTVLYTATTLQKSEDIISLLISRDNINIKTKHGNTCFHFIAYYYPNNYELAKKCIDVGGNMYSKNCKDETPLSMYNNKVKVLLLEYVSLKTEDTEIEFGKVPSCIMCLTNVAKILIVPCNHLILCSECCIKSKELLSICPMCKTKIGSYTRIFF